MDAVFTKKMEDFCAKWARPVALCPKPLPTKVTCTPSELFVVFSVDTLARASFTESNAEKGGGPV